MVFFTGDIHGQPWGVRKFCRRSALTPDDTLILLGDVGANYYGDERDDAVKEVLSSVSPTILCIHGNHEMRPRTVPGYELRAWNGGKVWVQDKYPRLLFAEDGEIYTIEGQRYIAIGGAYSVDKYYRILRGFNWFSDEQPDAETKARVEQQLQTHAVDVILSHTCPYKYIPREMFLPAVDQSKVDDSTERWLDSIEESTDYTAWYCGHWHTDKRCDRMHFLYHGFEAAEQVSAGEEAQHSPVYDSIMRGLAEAVIYEQNRAENGAPGKCKKEEPDDA